MKKAPGQLGKHCLHALCVHAHSENDFLKWFFETCAYLRAAHSTALGRSSKYRISQKEDLSRRNRASRPALPSLRSPLLRPLQTLHDLRNLDLGLTDLAAADVEELGGAAQLGSELVDVDLFAFDALEDAFELVHGLAEGQCGLGRPGGERALCGVCS